MGNTSGEEKKYKWLRKDLIDPGKEPLFKAMYQIRSSRGGLPQMLRNIFWIFHPLWDPSKVTIMNQFPH